MSVKCQTILDSLNKLAPSYLAESWDNVGLLIGNPSHVIRGVAVALDVDMNTVKQAVEQGANLIIAHHPLIFEGITSIRQDKPQGDLLWQVIQNDIQVIAAHTNLDAAWNGVNDALAESIGLKDVRPLMQTYREKLFKLAVFVPASHAERVRSAMGDAGAGHIGAYSHCSFQTQGEGEFLPLSGANPFLGSPGQLERVSECKIETIVDECRCSQVVEAMLTAHPYEEVAYDLYPLVNAGKAVGIGRIGTLDQQLSLRDFAGLVKTRLGANIVKVSGKPDSLIQTVAVCGGSGADFISRAKAAGADALITGDVKYHEGQEAAGLGLAVIDAGHFATEYPVVAKLVDYLSACSKQAGWDVFIHPVNGQDIFWSV